MMQQMSIRPAKESDEVSVYDLVTSLMEFRLIVKTCLPLEKMADKPINSNQLGNY
jgi:hypothetical protein